MVNFCSQPRSSRKNFVKLLKTPGRVSYSTWFGLEINHGGKTASVRVPQYYSEQVEGLCGNFDTEKENDCFLRNGTVLPFIETRNKYIRTESEYKCGRDWKYPDEEDEPPPRKPEDPIVCAEGIEFNDVDKECEDLFDAEILKSCVEILDPEDFIDACKADLCVNPGPETKGDIIKTYIESCGDKRDEPDDLECVWFNEIPNVQIMHRTSGVIHVVILHRSNGILMHVDSLRKLPCVCVILILFLSMVKVYVRMLLNVIMVNAMTQLHVK